MTYARNYGIAVRIARFHNIFGPEGSWNDGREKVPAALCRKIATAEEDGEIEIGRRPPDALVPPHRRMPRRRAAAHALGLRGAAQHRLGGDATIDGLARTIMEVAGKRVAIRHVDGPLGVRGRRSDNTFIRERIGWAPSRPLREGLNATYRWIEAQVKAGREDR